MFLHEHKPGIPSLMSNVKAKSYNVGVVKSNHAYVVCYNMFGVLGD